MVLGERQKTIVVIGNGMVGHKFCEKLVELDTKGEYKITTFCEEKKTAYNRMRLTEVRSRLGRDAGRLDCSG